VRVQIGTLILATSGVQLANGYFGTFFSLRIATEDFGPSLSGLVLSSYFAGFILGAVCVERIIGKVGHIRAYAGCAGLVAAATNAMPVLAGPLPWLIFRTFVGFGCAGLFVTTESWLNAKADPLQRGRVFSIYMVGTFLALAAGQILIGWTNIQASAPFNAIAALFAAALIIVCMTRAEPPRVHLYEALPFRRLAGAVPIAILGCVVSGLISSVFYTLIPVWMQGEGIEQGMIGLIMLAAVLGGLAFQIPMGRLSDRFDRRSVLAAVSLGLTATAVGLLLLPHTLPVILPASVLFGGFMSTLYPICVAYAHDQMPADRVVGVSSRLILISGIGSVVGPFIGTTVMTFLDLDGILCLMAVAAFILGIVAVSGLFVATAAPHLARPFEVLTPQATALAHDLTSI
jgi:MFS family permease